MTYKINLLANADDDLAWFRQNDRTSYVKYFELVHEIAKNPRVGVGKRERLRYFEPEISNGLYDLQKNQEIDISFSWALR